MASIPKKSHEEAIEAEVTELVPHRDFSYDSLAEKQKEILEQLYRRLQPSAGPSCPELNAVWLRLGREWSWVAVVPGEPDYPTTELARSLAQTGTRLSVSPVEFVDGKDLDLERSARLIAQLGFAGTDGSNAARRQQFASASYAAPITKTVVALESPLANPLALPVAVAADGVVLCVRRGRDRLASVRDTINSIGAERILCCVLVD